MFQGLVAGDNTKRTEMPICDSENVLRSRGRAVRLGEAIEGGATAD